ncbi:MAG: phosphotransferase [Pirellulaceae bacterium]|nr:phosphotransferase [Pirellulaceae bacterium]
MSATTDALGSFLPLVQVQRIDPHRGSGWSGAGIWRVHLQTGQLFCLRRWPVEHPSPERLRLIHAVLTYAGRSGIDFLPIPRPAAGGETFVKVAGTLWELTPWMPGNADFRSHPHPQRLEAALEALARFHASTADFAPARGPAPALVERLARAEEWLDGPLDRLGEAGRRTDSTIRDAADAGDAARSILFLAGKALPRLRDRLALAAGESLRLQPAIRDLHHEHVLFIGNEVSGFIDFGALRIDTPLADIARLVGSLIGDDPPGWERALDAYDRRGTLTAEDRAQIRLLDESGTVLGGLEWLRWLWLEKRDMGDPQRVAGRLEELAARLRVLSGL